MKRTRAIVLLTENIHAARTVAKEKLAWKLASKMILLKRFLASNMNVSYQTEQGREENRNGLIRCRKY